MIEISIDTGSDAFGDDSGKEVARILRKLADEFADDSYSCDGRDSRKLLDFFGNTVGTMSVNGG